MISLKFWYSEWTLCSKFYKNYIFWGKQWFNVCYKKQKRDCATPLPIRHNFRFYFIYCLLLFYYYLILILLLISELLFGWSLIPNTTKTTVKSIHIVTLMVHVSGFYTVNQMIVRKIQRKNPEFCARHRRRLLQPVRLNYTSLRSHH